MYEKVEGGGRERGTFRVQGNVFFIVEWLGRGSSGVFFFSNSLWDEGLGCIRGKGAC
jgi:hypothetical protein